ncbi:hypothetical protein ACFY3N_00040 [Streptomyces sp. NPDC000348]|uniref:hypothetical protein n=1 Tax=Streptomyces sp. NPDC000348 TaxID=3364538 RepID=UPI0036CF924A
MSGVDEEMLWPKAVKDRIKSDGDREIIHSYPYRSSCPSTVRAELVEKSTPDILFAGYTNYFLWIDQPAFVSTLHRKLDSGCRVRLLLGDPDGEAPRSREQTEDVALTVSTRSGGTPVSDGRQAPVPAARWERFSRRTTA